MTSKRAIWALFAREARALRNFWIASAAAMTAAALWLFFVQPAAWRYTLLDSERVRIFAYGGALMVGAAAAYLQVQDERKEGTWGGFWLLPVDRRVLFFAKSAVGLGSVLIGAVLPASLLVLLVVGARARGGPLPLSGALHPFGAALAGALAYFSAWLASDRDEARILGTRLIPILSALAVTVLAVALKSVHVLATAAVLVFAVVVMAAAVAHVTVERGAARSRPSVAVALTVYPALALASLLGFEAWRSLSPPPVTSSRYETLDAEGAAVVIDRARGVATATLVMAELRTERLSPEMGLRQFEQGGIRGFYDAGARTYDLYDTRSGEKVGCLGASGFEAGRCDGLAGRVFDVVTVGAVHLLLTEGGVYRVEANQRRVEHIVRAELSDGHAILDQRAPIAIRRGETVEAIDIEGRVIAHCVGLGSQPVHIGITGGGRLAGVRVDDRTSFACDENGAWTATGTFTMSPPKLERSVQAKAVEASMGMVPVLVSRWRSSVDAVDPWPAALLSLASALAAAVLLSILGARRAAPAAAVVCGLFGPVMLVALGWLNARTLLERLRSFSPKG